MARREKMHVKLGELSRRKEIAGGQERNLFHRATGNGAWLSAIIHRLNGTKLSQEKFRDNLRLRYGLMPQDIPANCYGCGKRFSIEHALSFPKDDLVLARNDETAKEWGALGYRALFHSAITYKLKINSRTVQGERTGAGARQENGIADSGTHTVGRSQGVRIVNSTVRLVGILEQVEFPEESRSDVGAHSFWKKGTTVMFDIRIVNLNTGSYLRRTPEKALAKVEKENKYLYIKACLERRRNFTPMVYYADGIPGADALAAQNRLATLLSYKLKREYSEMCDFVRARMSLAIVRSNSLLLRGPC